MKTATKHDLRENRFDTFVAKTSVFNINWIFGLPTNVAPLFMKKKLPQKQFKNAIEIIPFFSKS